MPDITTKAGLMVAVAEERRQLDEVLARLAPDQFMQPGVEGDWTAKDVLAHIAYWETVMVSWIESSMAGQTPDRPALGFTWEIVHAMNAANCEAHRHQPLAEVQAFYEQAHQRALAAIGAMPEAAIFEPGYFPWTNERPFLVWIEANTTEHYAEHHEDLLAWLAGQTG